MNFIRNRNFRAGPQTSLEGFICPQNSDKQQKIKVFGRSGGGNIEHVIVDDGSLNSTASIVEDYAKQHPHVVSVKFPQNRGTNAARNEASSAVTVLSSFER